MIEFRHACKATRSCISPSGAGSKATLRAAPEQVRRGTPTPGRSWISSHCLGDYLHFTALALLVATIGGAYPQSARADSVVAWGYNGEGQLGNGTTTNHNSMVAVNGMDSGVTAVAAGALHSLSVQNGAVYAWGNNVSAELGDGGVEPFRTTPVAVSGLSSGVTTIAARGYQTGGYSLAVKNGALYSWGSNTSGQLGDGTTSGHPAPVPVAGFTSGVTDVSAGYSYSLAVKNGALYAWGSNTYGQLGDGTLINRALPVAVSGLSSGVTAIAAGTLHSLAVRNGGAYAWAQITFTNSAAAVPTTAAARQWRSAD